MSVALYWDDIDVENILYVYHSTLVVDNRTFISSSLGVSSACFRYEMATKFL